MSENWVFTDDGTTATVSGRTPETWAHKLNPIWWFKNDEEPEAPDWYKPTSSYLVRTVSWYARNPLQNFSKYVIGVSDRNYAVRGLAPLTATTWDDLDGGRRGFKWSIIRLGWLRLPFVSYTGKHVLWYAGWQWWGFAGLKWNWTDSPINIV